MKSFDFLNERDMVSFFKGLLLRTRPNSFSYLNSKGIFLVKILTYQEFWFRSSIEG